jgi:hypothetical protein
MEEEKEYKITIVWKQEGQPDAKPQTYAFRNEREAWTFRQGARRALGWDGFTVTEPKELAGDFKLDSES